jgi:hypothetical protein
MKSTYGRFAALAAVLFIVAACSDSGTEPVETPAELSQLLSQATTTGVPASLFGLPSLTGPGSCPFAAATQNFVCPVQTTAGITVTRSYQLLNGSGAPQTEFSASVTAIRVSTSIAGTVTPSAIPGLPSGVSIPPATIQRQEVMTLTGLGATSQRILAGTATSTISTTINTGGQTLPVTVAAADTVANITLPANPGTLENPAFPISGSVINNQLVSVGSGLTTLSQRVRVMTTFNGTSTVTVAMTMAGQTTTCTINLATRPPVAPSCS